MMHNWTSELISKVSVVEDGYSLPIYTKYLYKLTCSDCGWIRFRKVKF